MMTHCKSRKAVEGDHQNMESEFLVISIMLTGIALIESDFQHMCITCAFSGHGCGQMIVTSPTCQTTPQCLCIQAYGAGDGGPNIKVGGPFSLRKRQIIT